MKTLVKRAVDKFGRMFFPEHKSAEPAPVQLQNPYPIRTPAAGSSSVVDNYWGDYTIKSTPYVTPQAVLDFLKWRSDHFHKSYEFKGFWDDHHNETMLDYGCGPGHDLAGFLVYSKPAKIYGIDISYKALSLAGHNIGLHKIPADQLELIQTADLNDRIPLPDASIDYLHSCGVVHHTTMPESILREFHRVLKSSGRGLIMVYNKNSVFFHLYAAYAKSILDPQFAGQTVEEAFVQLTDGPQCPISRAYESQEFIAMCEQAGFEAEFVGGFVASNELDLWKMHGAQALKDPRLVDPHRSFIQQLEWDDKGLPMFRGKYAGIGGTYRIRKK